GCRVGLRPSPKANQQLSSVAFSIRSKGRQPTQPRQSTLQPLFARPCPQPKAPLESPLAEARSPHRVCPSRLLMRITLSTIPLRMNGAIRAGLYAGNGLEEQQDSR